MHFFAGRFHSVAAVFLLIIIYRSSLLRNKKKDASLAFSMSKLLSQRVNLNWFSQQGYVAFFGKLSLSVLAFLYKHVCFHGIRALSKETRHMPMQSGVAPVRGGRGEGGRWRDALSSAASLVSQQQVGKPRCLWGRPPC